jgi:hypothetical protein
MGFQAEATNYDELLAAFRARAAERKLVLSDEATADVAGLPAKYLPKLIGSNPVRRIGMISLAPVLGVLGLKILIVEDEEAVARYGSQLKLRNDNLVHGGILEIRLTDRHMRKIRKRGGQNRWAKLTAKQRSALGRKLNKIRWSKPRLVEVTSATGTKT